MAPNNPVCVMDSSYHACYANSAAMALVGIDRDTPDPRGGEIHHDAQGEPNGILWERAMDPGCPGPPRFDALLHRHCSGPMSWPGLVQQNAKRHLSHGITSVGDALVMPESAEIYRLTDERGDAPDRDPPDARRAGLFSPRPTMRRAARSWRTMSLIVCAAGSSRSSWTRSGPVQAMTVCHADGSTEHAGDPYYGQEEVDHLVLDACVARAPGRDSLHRQPRH